MSKTSPDWSRIPAPVDDGGADHLTGMAWPPLALPGTDGASPEGWEMIPGARGYTPQSCAFRDHLADLRAAGVDHVFGVSVQDTDWQQEAAARLHLPFPLLSDAQLHLAEALRLLVMTVAGKTLLKRMVLVLDAARIGQVFYPVFPPDRSADLVLDWLKAG